MSYFTFGFAGLSVLAMTGIGILFEPSLGWARIPLSLAFLLAAMSCISLTVEEIKNPS